MANFDFDAVIKIGSMALIRQDDNDIDYNIIARLARELVPGYILVSSGATEIGRLDYMKRNAGRELKGDMEEIKTDYAAQGQSLLMHEYRRFIPPSYSIRQVLVEHGHFNDKEKRDHLVKLFFRAANQNAIPIVNYNDPVSSEENRKMEIASLRGKDEEIVECVDNDETAAVVCQLVHAKTLVMLTSVDGIYSDPSDPSTLIEEIAAGTFEEIMEKIDVAIGYCRGSSRELAAGASAKLKYAVGPLKNGSSVIIANARYSLGDIFKGAVRQTRLRVG